jgi:hypothetical protein
MVSGVTSGFGRLVWLLSATIHGQASSRLLAALATRLTSARHKPKSIREIAIAGLALSLFLPLGATVSLGAAGDAVAQAGAKIKIAFAGDSIVDNYWSGMTRIVDANPCLKQTVELGRFARNGTGLTRGDRVYWPREIKRIDDTFKPTLSVLSIGLNDRQFIVDGNGIRTAWGAPDWTDKYRHEVFEFLTAAVASKAIVLLVGMPAMREAIDNDDVAGKNAMYAEAIKALDDPRLHYVEPWKLHASGTETFSSYGPDKTGRLVQIRTSDGQHFTVAGEDLAASYLYPKIVAALNEAGIAVDQCLVRQTKDEQ